MDDYTIHTIHIRLPEKPHDDSAELNAKQSADPDDTTLTATAKEASIIQETAHEGPPTESVAPPTVVTSNITIRQNERIDWSDVSNNAIGSYNRRLESAYLANTWRSDMHFHIISEQLDIPAHALIISTASAQLEHLCFVDGDGNGRDNNPIRIDVPDCTSADFLIVLRYLYSGGNGGSLVQLTPTNIVPITKIAKLFELHHLSGQCNHRLATMLSTETVCDLYTKLWPIRNAFTQQCLDLMVRHLEGILSNDTAMQMPDEPLFKLFAALENTSATPHPEHVLQALKRRADRELVAADMPQTGANRRLLIGDRRFKLVAFELMTVAQFANSLHDIGPDFMSDAEIGAMFKRVLLGNPMELSERHQVIGCSCGKGGPEGEEVDPRESANDYCCLAAGKLKFASEAAADVEDGTGSNND